MVVIDKYSGLDQIIEIIDPSSTGHGSDSDAPPSYETITTTSQSGSSGSTSTTTHIVVDEKSSRHSTTIPPSERNSTPPSEPISPRPRASSSQLKHSSSSWLSFTSTSTRPSKDVRQTVLTLLRDLVLNPDSPNLLSSCADACRTYNLDFAALLQEPYIEGHSPIYWAILNKRAGIMAPMVGYATPLSQQTVSEVRLACLATSNQELFQALRNQKAMFEQSKAPLSSSSGADALVLGPMPSDEVSIQEMEGEGAFVADMKFNLWQKRMRVSGRVTTEFIARGRIWSLTFFSTPPTRTSTAGWQVAVCLLEHSPPTFIDSRLVVDQPSQPNDLISLSPPPEDSNSPSLISPTPSSPSPSLALPASSRFISKSKSKPPKKIEIRIKTESIYQLAYNASKDFPSALQQAFTSRDAPWPPKVVTWPEDRSYYTNAIVVPLEENAGRGAELMYDTPFIGMDGTLHIRLETKLGKPQGKDCIIC